MPVIDSQVKLYLGDCLEVLPNLKHRSIDLILCDPPYGTTANEWDSVIPLPELWMELPRVRKIGCPIVLTSAQPFTTDLIQSNREMFQYTWVWDKVNSKTGFLDSKRRPLRVTEDVVVFCGSHRMTYNPQMSEGTPYKAKAGKASSNYGGQRTVYTVSSGDRFPTDLIQIKGAFKKGLHPTQKPVALMEYLIKTYTNENELVLDFAMGSGTTGVACVNLNRRFIGIEKDPEYFKIAKERIYSAKSKTQSQ